MAVEATTAALERLLPSQRRSVIWYGLYLAVAVHGVMSGFIGVLTIVVKDLIAGG